MIAVLAMSAASASALPYASSLPEPRNEPQDETQQEGVAEAAARRDRTYAPTPEERAERAAELMAAAKQRGLPYYALPSSVLAGAEPEAPVQRKSALDPDAMLRVFDGDGGPEAPRQVFDAFLAEVVNPAADEGRHGEEAARAIHDTDWGDRLIRATIETLDSQGADGPKAVKKLIERGAERGVPREHAALMWMARDLLVRRAVDGLIARLNERHPNLRFEVNILDSGSYGSIGSDIDKTLHLVAWDDSGAEVRAFGPGGQVMGGDIEAFISMVYDEFNALGRRPEYGARGPIRLSLDTEFFRSDTLPRRHSFGATFTSSSEPINIAAARLREAFAALQINPGPSYQWDGKVNTQVVGRTVETDVKLQDEIARLRQMRDQIDEMSGDARRSLVLDEMIRSVHSPAIAVSRNADGSLEFRQLDVIAFLERNNLTVRYDATEAAQNAAGDYEKIRHKRHKIIRADGSFDDGAYELYRKDIAKYHSRTNLDTATVKFRDDGGDKPAAFGEFDRRFGATDARGRFGLDNEPPNLRAFTEEVHRQMMQPALERMYASRGVDAETSRPMIEADLAMLWAAHRVSETLMAIKDNPQLEVDRYPPDELYRPLLEYIDAHEVTAVPDSESPAEARARRIEAAKRLHLDAAERAGVLLMSEEVQILLDRWLGSADLGAVYTDELEAGQRKILRLQGELDDLERRPAPDNDAEARARRQDAELLRQRITGAQQEMLRMSSDPELWRADKIMAGHDVIRRLVELFAIQGNDEAIREIVRSMPDEYRADIGMMTRVWAAQAEARAQSRLAQLARLDLNEVYTRVRSWSADIGRRLGYGYTQAFGVDVDGLLSRGAPSGTPVNAPHQVFGRFFVNNYMNRGAFDSGLRLLRVMQQSEGMPWDVRMQLLGEAATAEAIGPIPGIGPLYATWTGYRAGEPMLVAGGAMQLAAEVMQHLAEGGAVAEYANLMVLALSMARTGVEIVGHEAFEPVRDHYFQLAWQGYVNPQEAGLIRAGARDAQSGTPVTPIIEPAGVGAIEFVYLDPEQSQQLLEEFRAAGRTDAAVAMLRFAGRDENLGDRLDDVPGGLLIDLRTDFDALIAQADARVAAYAELPDAARARLRRARDGVVDLWSRLATLQRAVRDRIAADRERRDDSGAMLNLWLLGARQNVGRLMASELDAQVQLLFRHLLGDPDARSEMAREAEVAWSGWLARSPSFVAEERTRAEFDGVMRPDVAYRARLESLRTQLADAGAGWGFGDITSPGSGVVNYLAEQGTQWLGFDTPAQQQERQRQQRELALQRAVAALGAIGRNSWANRPEVLPSTPYRLEEVTRWFGEEIRGWQRALIEMPLTAETPTPLVELVIDAERRLAEMKAEHGLVMEAFAEADALVAPKVAHLLLMEWIAGEGRYDNDAHLALDFLWQDAETQRRIRDALATDLVSGRRLLPRYRAQAATLDGLLEAALADAHRELLRIGDDAINQRVTEAALKQLDKSPDTLDPYRAFGGELQLQSAAYLLLGGDGIDVAVDARVDHDVYRAVQVDVGWDYQILPPDALEQAVGAEAVARALELTGLQLDEILMAFRVRVGVTNARAAAGYKEIEYTGEYPRDDEHLLLVPGEVDRTLVPADPALSVCALVADAPEELPDEEAWRYCDPAITQPTRFDRVAVFFTPARDLRIPSYEQQLFKWQIVDDRGRRVRGGDFVGDMLSEEEYDTYDAGVVPLAPEGAPAAFSVVLPAWQRVRQRPDETGIRDSGLWPGTYTVQTRKTKLDAGSGVFGQGDPGIYYDADAEPEWTDELTFEIADASLKFRGFVAEQVRDAIWPEVDGIWEGRFTVHEPQIAGSTVTLEAEATWQKIADDGRPSWEQRDPTEPERPDPESHRMTSRMTAQFPDELLPGNEEMGAVELKVESQLEEPFTIVAGMHLLVPGSGEPPDRHLVQGESDLPGPWAEEGLLPDTYCTGATRQFDQDVASGVPSGVNLVVVWPRLSYWYRCTYRGVRAMEGTITLHGGEPDVRAGTPPRPLGQLLHDPETLWVLPVFFQLSDAPGLTTPGEGLKMRAYGYAIYGPEATPYAGAMPRGGPETGTPRDGIADADDGDDSDDDEGTGGTDTGDTGTGDTGTGDTGTGDTGTGDTGTGETGEGGTGEGGTGGGDTGDTGTGADADTPPGSINPADPDVAALIREWINVAKPPENAALGANLHYNVRGHMVGTTPGGIIYERGEENYAFDATYLWTNARANDSIDHCTMEEFVQARVAGESIAQCAGRYRPMTDVVGRPATAARSELEAQGHGVDLSVGDPAPSAELAFTVARQTPSATSHIRRDGRVELLLYGEYAAGIPAPDVVGMSAAQAREAIEDAGLQADISIGDAAPSAAEAFSVYGQEPAAGATVEEGGSVKLTIFSDYRPRARVPYLTGHTVEQAREALTALGLSVRAGSPGGAGEAPSPDSEGRVARTVPPEGTEVDAGAEVGLVLYGEFRDPRCADLLSTGLNEANAGNLDRARELLAQARQLDCPDDDLDEAIRDVDRAIADRDRERARQQRCDSFIQNGNRQWQSGDLDGALATFRQARAEGCTNDGLDRGIADLERLIRERDAARQRQQRCDSLIQNGNRQWQSGDLDGALTSYRQARSEGCSDSGLDDAIARIEQAIRDRQQQQDRYDRCESLVIAGNQQLQAENLDGALANYRQARAEGCTNPGLDDSIADLERQIRDRDNRQQNQQNQQQNQQQDRNGPFTAVVGAYMPFDQSDAGRQDVEEALRARIADVNSWHPALPLVLDFSGDALRAYSRSNFALGSRWALPLRMEIQNREGRTLVMEGAMLLEVTGVYDSVAAAVAVNPAAREIQDPLRFQWANGRLRQNFSDERSTSLLDAGPLEAGWSPAMQQAAQRLMVTMIENMDFCFVATAVYQGREGAPLERLRAFRDEVLFRSATGRRLAMLYYRDGPRLARWVREHPAVRPLLEPVFDLASTALGRAAHDPVLAPLLDVVVRWLGDGIETLPPDPGPDAALHRFRPRVWQLLPWNIPNPPEPLPEAMQ